MCSTKYFNAKQSDATKETMMQLNRRIKLSSKLFVLHRYSNVKTEKTVG
jgi:hypothetical protein